VCSRGRVSADDKGGSGQTKAATHLCVRNGCRQQRSVCKAAGSQEKKIITPGKNFYSKKSNQKMKSKIEAIIFIVIYSFWPLFAAI
jgi:hypothetical protein